MKLNWNFLGGRGAKQKNLLGGGEYGYFLEVLHNLILVSGFWGNCFFYGVKLIFSYIIYNTSFGITLLITLRGNLAGISSCGIRPTT